MADDVTTKVRAMLLKNGDVQAFIVGFVLGWLFSFIAALLNRHGIGMSFGRGLIGGAVVGGLFWGVKFAVYKIAPELFERDTPHEGPESAAADTAPASLMQDAAATPSAAAAAYAGSSAAKKNDPMFVPPPSPNALREEEERKARFALTRSNVDGLEEDYVSTIPPPPVQTAAAPVMAPAAATAPATAAPARNTPPPLDEKTVLVPSVDPSGDVDKNSVIGHNTGAASDTIDAIIAPQTRSLIDDFALDKAKEQMRIDAKAPDQSEGTVRGFSATQSGATLVYDKNQEIKIPNNPEVMARAVRTMLKRDADGGK